MHRPLDPAFPNQRTPDEFTEPSWFRTAQMATHRLSGDVAVIAAQGELDAANTDEFVEYTLRQAARCSHIILDLTGVDFFGSAGFAALHRVNHSCGAQDVDLIIVASPAVRRLLRICDPDAALPVTQNAPTAISAAHRGIRLLELIPKSR
jgi:anti-anti-sigma factor